MTTILMILQIIVAFGLLNVWLIRFNQATPYRGGAAKTMKEEFVFYGLPVWFSYFIGALKISVAIALLAGIWMPMFVTPALFTLLALMLGAIAMHIKVRDPIKKSVPAVLMLSMTVFLLSAGYIVS